MYGYSVADAKCTPNTTVGSSKSSVTFLLPVADVYNNLTYCLLFLNNECMQAALNGSVSG